MAQRMHYGAGMSVLLRKQKLVVVAGALVATSLGCGSSTGSDADAGPDGPSAPMCETKQAVDLGAGTVRDAGRRLSRC